MPSGAIFLTGTVRSRGAFALAALGVLAGLSGPAFAQESYVSGFFEFGSRRPAWRFGWNEDTLCYPDMGNCSGRHDGSAWLYRVGAGGQMAFGLAWGSGFGSGPRLEVSVDGALGGGIAPETLVGVFYRDDSARPFPTGPTISRFGMTGEAELVGELTAVAPDPNYRGASIAGWGQKPSAITASVNFLYDFPVGLGLTPYFGFGFGYTVVSTRFGYTASYAGRPELETSHDSGILGRALTTRAILGLGWRPMDRFGFALESVMTGIGEFSGETEYQIYPEAPTARNGLRDLRRAGVRLVLRYYY